MTWPHNDFCQCTECNPSLHSGNPYRIAATTISSLRGLFRYALDREPTLEEIVDMLEEIADHQDPLTGWVSRLDIMDRIVKASKVRT